VRLNQSGQRQQFVCQKSVSVAVLSFIFQRYVVMPELPGSFTRAGGAAICIAAPV
jgi:hypothetical protein